MDYLRHVVEQSARFAAAFDGVEPAARVPTCPDWSAADLAWHLSEVHHFWAEIVGRRLDDPHEAERTAPARPDELPDILAVYERTTAAMVDALAAADDAEQVWTWASDRTVGFVRRFQAHEALMHRVDAELAAGRTPAALPAELADDGIGVMLGHALSWHPDWASLAAAGPVGEVVATDTGGRRLARIDSWSGTSPDTGKTYDGEPYAHLVDAGEPLFSFTGTAAALDGWRWGRPGFGEVTGSGDEQALARFRTLAANGVP